MSGEINEDAARRADLDEVVMAALAVGDTYAEAGVSERTVRRRMSEPTFAGEVSARRGEFVGALAGQLVASGPEAVAVVRRCLISADDAVALRAAQLLLTMGNQLRHAHELEVRLAALEAGTATAAGEGRR